MIKKEIELSELILESDGLVVFHNQRCGVYTNQKAVFNTNLGIFEPSWYAQKEGWKLIKLNNWFQILLFKLFFSKRD